jgi:hypothetical protein
MHYVLLLVLFISSLSLSLSLSVTAAAVFLALSLYSLLGSLSSPSLSAAVAASLPTTAPA